MGHAGATSPGCQRPAGCHPTCMQDRGSNSSLEHVNMLCHSIGRATWGSFNPTQLPQLLQMPCGTSLGRPGVWWHSQKLGTVPAWRPQHDRTTLPAWRLQCMHTPEEGDAQCCEYVWVVWAVLQCLHVSAEGCLQVPLLHVHIAYLHMMGIIATDRVSKQIHTCQQGSCQDW